MCPHITPAFSFRPSLPLRTSSVTCPPPTPSHCSH
uniref:Uncharacterized protein n=1 Tax=Parascaris univalens TaxID=6257 RepID=A0A915BQM0_PARUN